MNLSSVQKRIIEALKEHTNFMIPEYDGKTGVGTNTLLGYS